MKILVINGSPRKEKGNTEILVNYFIKGAESAGANCETIYTKDLNINNCMGCFGCWKKTPGKCVIKDDMEEVLMKMRESDVIVYATPLYHFGMTADLKKVIERTLPIAHPYIVNNGEKYSHPRRYTDFPEKFVIISNCGFPERINFNAMMENFYAITGKRIVGEILCTAGEFLKTPLKDHIKWYLDAVVKAGVEVVKEGQITKETNESLKKNFIDTETFLKYANSSWEVPGENPPTVEEAKNGVFSMGRRSTS
ncbi:MAG: flavodoxin family protein [Clostridiaceae bacterium]|nr:flavodoxin family protein [Clostridiaceae bacterium]